MKNNKILPKILIVVLSLTLISALILSSVYAKYVSSSGDSPYSFDARGAGFAFDVIFDDYVNIEAGYTIDDEPGNPIGHTEARRYYDFEVQSCESEVALNIATRIDFSEKVSAMVRQARDDRFATSDEENGVFGVCCDYELMLWNPTTSEYELVVQRGEAVDSRFTITETGVDPADSNVTSTISSTVTPKKNADGTDTGYAKYRLVIVIYNNTLMPTDGNGSNYFLDSNAMTVNVSATQVDPEYVGTPQ